MNRVKTATVIIYDSSHCNITLEYTLDTTGIIGDQKFYFVYI